MTTRNGAHAPTGTACLKKAVELFYVTHPKAARARLGPFLTEADAEFGRVIMRNSGAVVTAWRVAPLDDLTRCRAESNGRVVRLFMKRLKHD